MKQKVLKRKLVAVDDNVSYKLEIVKVTNENEDTRYFIFSTKVNYKTGIVNPIEVICMKKKYNKIDKDLTKEIVRLSVE